MRAKMVSYCINLDIKVKSLRAAGIENCTFLLVKCIWKISLSSLWMKTKCLRLVNGFLTCYRLVMSKRVILIVFQ